MRIRQEYIILIDKNENKSQNSISKVHTCLNTTHWSNDTTHITFTRRYTQNEGSLRECITLLCFAFAYIIYLFFTAIQYHPSNVFALIRFDDIIPNPIFKYTKTMKCIASPIRNRQWLIHFMERQKWQLKVEYMYNVLHTMCKKSERVHACGEKEGKERKNTWKTTTHLHQREQLHIIYVLRVHGSHMSKK